MGYDLVNHYEVAEPWGDIILRTQHRPVNQEQGLATASLMLLTAAKPAARFARPDLDEAPEVEQRAIPLLNWRYARARQRRKK
jgi:hypothetical protein